MNINSSFKTILKSCHAAKPAWATAMATPLPSLQPTRTPVARRVAPADLEAEPPAPGSHGDGWKPRNSVSVGWLLLLAACWMEETPNSLRAWKHVAWFFFGT